MVKIRNLVIVLLFGFHASLFASAIEQPWLDNKVRSFIKGKPVKAMVYGLWINGKPISIQAIGNSMTAVPATKDMHFRIGGVTETLLTTALMLLVEKRI